MDEQRLLDQLPSGIAWLASDYRFQRVNHALCRMAGYTEEDLTSLRLLDIVHPDDRHDARAALRQLETGQIDQHGSDLRYVGNRGDAGWMHLLIRLENDEAGATPVYVAVIHDITRRKHAENELVRIKEECERTFDAVPDCIAILDTEHRIVQVNKGMTAALGCAPEQIVGRPCHEVVHGSKQPFPSCPHTCLLADGCEHRVEVHEERMGGHFLVSVTPRYDTDGTVIGSIHVARDITDRKRAEEELRVAYDTLEKRVRQRTVELADVNQALRSEINEREKLEREVLQVATQEQRRMGEELHDELGQELTGLGYLASSLDRRLRKQALPEAETSAELVAGIGQALRRTRAIARGLLPVEIDAANLRPALEALTVDIQERFEVSCHLKSRGRLGIRDDHSAIQLYRIAQGAVNNAIKHSQAATVDIELETSGHQTTLQIRDDGIGIPGDAEKGTGSGLRIMRYRARAIGGRFVVKRGADGGTVVLCILQEDCLGPCE
jgi:PAS domain S-box-containing protein